MTTTFSDILTILNQMAGLDPADLQASLDSSTLTTDQETVLRQLADHFLGPEGSPQSASSTPPATTSKDPWGPFHRCRHPVLDTVYQGILASGPRHFVDSYRDATIHDGIMSASKSAQQRSVQRLRELFTALAFYDIGRHHFPGVSGKRLSDRMKNELKLLIPECDVVEQYKVGKNLACLCETLGMGCVLYLAQYLSNDFLCKKFTASGRYHDGAISHLKSLNLKQVAADSGASAFVQKVRMLSRDYLERRG
ncbi:unnamed protein product [Aureobasidium uvarum]|uniref:Uncharacterized protein n=1 Tax=Aureobasidium uvarum TaxID=2773716 RepID=A0A9N8KD43_9PEZI|nr:unnamed protein product [Aureobasidium uvarum]